ncbi:NERD domain-containing protein [Nocardioides glacieisoli]|uniref:NERD domain-containing protein n=2 Tax=Nocardioides glacieisoli TaxID=1168730 RepID=A0A4Q2RKC3_9ACTN|nr:NERD domain-containing protein [Nocardioides glacieisoli]
MRLHYAGKCRLCGAELAARAEAIYERPTKTVRCLECRAAAIDSDLPTPELETDGIVDVGTPGASARREFDRRQSKREERIRSKHPKLGGLILALSDDPQSTKSWDVGAVGEERVGTRLNELASESLLVLHDRRIPGSRANIDHIAVTATGVYVIDPKRYKGRPSLKVEGGPLRPRVEKLLVGSRDCTKLVDGVLKQVDVVRRVVGDEVPVRGVLCFVDADWPLIGGSFTTRDVESLWPRRLYPKLQADGPLTVDAIADLHRRLAIGLPAA